MSKTKVNTLHDRAMAWVAEKVKGRVNHTSPPRLAKAFLGNHYPDVVVRNPLAYRGREEYHEVEVVSIPHSRLREYTNAKHNGLMLNTGKRKLWLVLPRGSREAFDSISVIEKTGASFKVLR
jgi:hypothetical protein